MLLIMTIVDSHTYVGGETKPGKYYQKLLYHSCEVDCVYKPCRAGSDEVNRMENFKRYVENHFAVADQDCQ